MSSIPFVSAKVSRNKVSMHFVFSNLYEVFFKISVDHKEDRFGYQCVL